VFCFGDGWPDYSSRTQRSIQDYWPLYAHRFRLRPPNNHLPSPQSHWSLLVHILDVCNTRGNRMGSILLLLWKPVVRELIWILCPLWSALYLYGGYKQKNWRRLGLPLTLFATGLLCRTPLLPLVSSSLLLALSLRLPFTLIGNRITDSFLNWVWIWVLPLLQSSPSQVLHIEPLAVVVPVVVCGTTSLLSNLPATARYWPWKAVEGAWGFALAYSYCLALS